MERNLSTARKSCCQPACGCYASIRQVCTIVGPCQGDLALPGHTAYDTCKCVLPVTHLACLYSNPSILCMYGFHTQHPSLFSTTSP